MKQLSTARKFKLITKVDIFKKSKELETATKDESNDITEAIEFVQYGLYLAFYEKDLKKAKEYFDGFLTTGEFDTEDETVKRLKKKFKASFE